jgi:2-phospho-L-lactate guanylyltransferase
VDAAVLIPVKRFQSAKGRLAGTLTVDQRAKLARWLADRVVAASGGLALFVACDDDDVAAWADGAGAEVLWSPGLGLNGAVDAGRTTIAGKGFDHLVIAHSDLPLAHALDRLAVPGAVTLVPDRHRDGTNVLAMPIDADIPASYGGGSFRRHLDLAMATGARVRVVDDVRLALDIDNPADVSHPMAFPILPAWLRTTLASRR